MAETTTIISAVYQGGVFVPQADVSHLAEGTSVDIEIPAPDEWDQLLDAIAAEVEYDATQDAETLELTRGRWGNLEPDTARWITDSEDWLVWDLAEVREPSSVLL